MAIATLVPVTGHSILPAYTLPGTPANVDDVPPFYACRDLDRIDGGHDTLLDTDLDRLAIWRQDIRRWLGKGSWLTAMPHRFETVRVSFPTDAVVTDSNEEWTFPHDCDNYPLPDGGCEACWLATK